MPHLRRAIQTYENNAIDILDYQLHETFAALGLDVYCPCKTHAEIPSRNSSDYKTIEIKFKSKRPTSKSRFNIRLIPFHSS